MRALMRARAAVLVDQTQPNTHGHDHPRQADIHRAKQTTAYDPSVYNFSRQLLKGSEHTWGISVSNYGANLNGPYTNSEFHAQRDAAALVHGAHAPNRNRSQGASYITKFETAWQGQRKLTVDYPLAAVDPSHPLARRAKAELAVIDEQASAAPDPKAEGFVALAAVDTALADLAGWCSLQLSKTDGSIVSLTEGGRSWANDTYPLGLLRYQSLIDTDMAAWRQEYLIQDCPYEYGKPGCMTAKPTPIHQLEPPTPYALWIKNGTATGGIELLLESKFDASLHANYGAPSTVWTRFSVAPAKQGGTRSLEMTVTLINKTSTRLPEAMFMTMNPRPLIGTPRPPAPPPVPPPPPAGSAPVQRGQASIPSPGAGSDAQASKSQNCNIAPPPPISKWCPQS